jgi:hypothetical protein
MAKAMLYSRKFRQNSRPVWAKMMANLFRRGISVYKTYNAQAYEDKTGGYSAEYGIL